MDTVLQPRMRGEKEEKTSWNARYVLDRLKDSGTADCMPKHMKRSSKTILSGRKHSEPLGKSI